MDPDVIRHILVEMEKMNHPQLMKHILEPYDKNTISFHIALLLDAKYIEAKMIRPQRRSVCAIFMLERITFAGHEFLNNIRNDNIWNKTKSEAAKIGETVSLGVIKSIAEKFILLHLGM
jgi:Hypothetical protein (DUF2513).